MADTGSPLQEADTEALDRTNSPGRTVGGQYPLPAISIFEKLVSVDIRGGGDAGRTISNNTTNI